MTKIIIFNGPPGSGKDTFADKLADMLEKSGKKSLRYQFKDYLYVIARVIACLNSEDMHIFTNRALKEKPMVKLNGMSPRKFLIWCSEDVAKKFGGKKYFGEIMTKTISDETPEFAIFSDGGFIEEIQPLIDNFGADNVTIIRLHRDGYTFNGDSRTYLQDIGCREYDIKSEDIEKSFKNIVEVLFA